MYAFEWPFFLNIYEVSLFENAVVGFMGIKFIAHTVL